MCFGVGLDAIFVKRLSGGMNYFPLFLFLFKRAGVEGVVKNYHFNILL